MNRERQELRARIKDAVRQCLLDLWWNFDISGDDLDTNNLNELAGITKALEAIAEEAYARNHTIDA